MGILDGDNGKAGIMETSSACPLRISLASSAVRPCSPSRVVFELVHHSPPGSLWTRAYFLLLSDNPAAVDSASESGNSVDWESESAGRFWEDDWSSKDSAKLQK